MGEIINLQIGGCGNSVGSKFWETIASEHGIEVSGTYMGQHDVQLERIGVFYRELKSRRYIPRAVLVDLEPSTLDLVLSGRMGRMFPPGNYVFGNHLGGNWGSDNWARGFLENGPTIGPDILNVIRREAERTDTLQGFHLIHGSGGSAGGGLGCHLLLRLAEEYPNRIVSTSTVFHELWTASPEPFEPYGAVLSMQQLTEGSNITVCMGNGSLDTIANRLANVYSKPPYYTVDQFNLHLAQALAGVTTSLRFPSLVSSNLIQMERNMIPFPRLHFLTPSLVFDLPPRETSQSSFLDTFLNAGTPLIPDYGFATRYLTLTTTSHRNDFPPPRESELRALKNQHSSYFVQRIADNAPSGKNKPGTILANSTAIGGIFMQMLDEFEALFKRKAWVHLFYQNGLDEIEFMEAESSLKDLVTQYQEHQKVTEAKGGTTS